MAPAVIEGEAKVVRTLTAAIILAGAVGAAGAHPEYGLYIDGAISGVSVSHLDLSGKGVIACFPADDTGNLYASEIAHRGGWYTWVSCRPPDAALMLDMDRPGCPGGIEPHMDVRRVGSGWQVDVSCPAKNDTSGDPMS